MICFERCMLYSEVQITCLFKCLWGCWTFLVQDDEDDHDPMLRSLRKSKAGKELFAYAEGCYSRRQGEREIKLDIDQMQTSLAETLKVDNFTDESVRELVSARPLDILSYLLYKHIRLRMHIHTHMYVHIHMFVHLYIYI